MALELEKAAQKRAAFIFYKKFLHIVNYNTRLYISMFMRKEGKDLDSLTIVTKDNLENILNTPYVKNSRVAAFCSKCNKKFVTKPKTVAISGFLCKGCKIAFTKQNTDPETLKIQNKKKSEGMKKALIEKGKEIQEKRKQTMLERYGVEYITQSAEGLEKIKNTKRQKYGKDFNKVVARNLSVL